MNEEKPQKPPRIRNLIAFSALIMLLFCIIVGIQATRSYDQAVENGKQNAARLTTILADHVEQVFLSIDLALRRGVEQQYFNTLFGGTVPEHVESNFKMWVDESPQIVGMALVSEHGEVQVAANRRGYNRWLDYNQLMIEQEMFTAMQAGSDKSLYVGKHFSKDAQNSSLIILARRINRVDGSFGGLVMAAMDASYFVDFFTSVEAGSKRSMGLLLLSGQPLIAGPDADAASPEIIQSILATPELTPGKELTQTLTLGGSIKIVSVKTLLNLPLALDVVIDEKDFLAAWRQARIKDIGFLAIFTVFGSVLSFFALTMAKQIIYVEESEAAAILASQAKSEFLANMSHELRTPLNAIIGFSEMMESGYFGPMNAKQKERIKDIHLCGSHLLQLITDILEFSKGDAGKLELNDEMFEPADLVKETVRMMNEKIKSKSIDLNVDISPQLPRLFADKRKTRQILINLISNAVKFTPDEGQIKISAKLDQTGNMNVIVSDSGIGIAEEDIPIALSVFGQVHRSRSHEGTGLGLPLCKMFAELHGGKMALISKLGEGTTVRIIFPASRVEAAAPASDYDNNSQQLA